MPPASAAYATYCLFCGVIRAQRPALIHFPAVANLDIQRKKSAPSPWLLIVLALALLAGAAWYFLRPAPADEPAPPLASQEAAAPADSLAPDSPAAEARATPPPADAAPGVAQPEPQAAAEASATKAELLALVGTLAGLADRPDLREQAPIREQRDNLTSATARLADGDARASLRPGLVAVATYLRTIQQLGYPALEADALALQAQAAALSGRDATPAEQQQNHEFLARATALADELSAPAR